MAAYLGKLPKTAYTAQVVRMAARGGLNPHISYGPYRGTYLISLDAKNGPASSFGSICVGARSGRIIRMALYRGNGDSTGTRATGPTAVRAALYGFLFDTVQR